MKKVIYTAPSTLIAFPSLSQADKRAVLGNPLQESWPRRANPLLRGDITLCKRVFLKIAESSSRESRAEPENKGE